MLNSMLLDAEAATEEATHLIPDASETVERASKFVDSLKELIPSVISFGINLLIALIIFGVGKLLIKMLLKISKRFLDRTKVEITVSKFLLSLIRAIAYVVLILVILETVGVKTTSFLAVLTTASLAIGLALQGSLSNFAGGVLILILKPFKVGDYISTGALEGTVSKIDLFYTTLITLDNKMNIIPNGTLSNASLTNVTAFDTRRIDFEFGISYQSDISKAKEVLISCASEHNMVLKNKEIFAFVSSLDTSQVTLGLRVWVNTSDYWNVKFDLTEMVKLRLEKEGIEIPFNQIVVHEAEYHQS
ncbi:MAG: mechanosensitive ion channel [Lachnospiraceae bacterium]|nr:mechanosensitive ion channel [Lachnospiraceae bacterium]